MGETYRDDPVKAVRSQTFIKQLHQFVGLQFETRLTRFARSRGIQVVYEATILGSTKPKDVDIAVIDPQNGPLVMVGIRSQMSSVSKNVLLYYEGIVGEATSLQERFPISTLGYIYLHPLHSIKEGMEGEHIDHARYAKMYAAVSGRSGRGYKNLRGVFDEFAYMIVDFEDSPPSLHDDLVANATQDLDMRLSTFTDRMIAKFRARLLFWDVFA